MHADVGLFARLACTLIAQERFTDAAREWLPSFPLRPSPWCLTNLRWFVYETSMVQTSSLVGRYSRYTGNDSTQLSLDSWWYGHTARFAGGVHQALWILWSVFGSDPVTAACSKWTSGCCLCVILLGINQICRKTGTRRERRTTHHHQQSKSRLPLPWAN